jgi:N-acetylglutamate synthase-like GNAT family acetyltransferase
LIALEINFRSGKLEDLTQIEEVCKDVWGGHDYLPSSWAEFVNDPEQLTLVGEINGQIAGIYALHLQSTAAWWHAVRVATPFKRQGLAATMLEHSIQVAKDQNITAFRFATGEDNFPMHKLAERYGFEYRANYLCFNAKRLEQINFPQVRPVQETEISQAWEFSGGCSSWDGLYCDLWVWKDFTLEVFKAEVAKGNILGYFEVDKLTAMVLYKVHGDKEGSWLMPMWFGGTSQGIEGLARYLRFRFGEQNPQYEGVGVTIMASSDEKVRDGLLNAGYEPDLADNLRLYQLYLLKNG